MNNDELPNSYSWHWIDRDGTTKQKLLLDLQDKKTREDIISFHFRKFYKDAYGVELPGELVSRDNPHDFTFRNASREEFLLEIVAVSDTSAGFLKQSNP